MSKKSTTKQSVNTSSFDDRFERIKIKKTSVVSLDTREEKPKKK